MLPGVNAIFWGGIRLAQHHDVLHNRVAIYFTNFLHRFVDTAYDQPLDGHLFLTMEMIISFRKEVYINQTHYCGHGLVRDPGLTHIDDRMRSARDITLVTIQIPHPSRQIPRVLRLRARVCPQNPRVDVGGICYSLH